jgi:hypothetical protein
VLGGRQQQGQGPRGTHYCMVAGVLGRKEKTSMRKQGSYCPLVHDVPPATPYLPASLRQCCVNTGAVVRFGSDGLGSEWILPCHVTVYLVVSSDDVICMIDRRPLYEDFNVVIRTPHVRNAECFRSAPCCIARAWASHSMLALLALHMFPYSYETQALTCYEGQLDIQMLRCTAVRPEGPVPID